MLRPFRSLPLLAFSFLPSLAGPALAIDGVLEINQTCVVETGCFAGDLAGFPLSINAPGSYRLTGDLTAGHNEPGILISASGVTLDMNGFQLVSASSNSTSVDGIAGSGLGNIEIRDGTVQGFRGRGIIFSGSSSSVRIIDMRTLQNGFQGVDLDGGGHFVSSSTSSGNLLWGFSLDGDSMIIDSVAKDNASFGLVLDPNTGYRGMLVAGNNGGNLNAQVTGGVDIGLNLCGGDTICP